jgi:hypothetical protein
MPPPVAPPPSFVSNYPRGGQAMFGYVRPPGVYWDSLSTSISMVFGHWTVYVVSALIAFLIIGAAYIPFVLVIGASVFTAAGRMSPTFPLLTIGPAVLLQLVNTFMLLCLMSVGVRHAQGITPELGDFFIPFRRFGKSVVATLWISLPLILVQILNSLAQYLMGSAPMAALGSIGFALVTAGVAYFGFYGTLLLSGVSSIFSELTPLDASKRLYSSLGWNTLMLNLLVIVGGMLAGLSALLCLVGMLFGYPIMGNLIALHFVYCFPAESAASAVGSAPAETIQW